MKIFGTKDKEFINSLQCFSELPKKIPASSIMAATDKKAVSILCIYYDAGVCFIHGLFRSKFASDIEFQKSIVLFEKFISKTLAESFPIVCYSKNDPIKKLFKRNKFKEENISMLVREL